MPNMMMSDDTTALATLRVAIEANRALDMALHTGRPHKKHCDDRDTALAVLGRGGRPVTLYQLDGYRYAADAKTAPVST